MPTSRRHRMRGVRVLKAVSSPLRLQILNLLSDKGPLSYTELMSSLKMNPSRDAGRYAYHLKSLLKTDLIEVDVDAKKYFLTEMGRMVIDVADKINKKVSKPKKMFIRASRSALEEFDANRIANSLIREAKMPPDLAQRVAKEAEKHLIKSKTKYLTAPLVREIVNAILIKKGLEEYRHKLTRLGLPVHDVTKLVELEAENPQELVSIQEAAGRIVFKEYVLLNVFPRDIADAHLSGALHINGLSSWILKPTEVMHDLRFFLQNGLNLEKISSTRPSYPPPKDLESALSLALNVLLYSAREIGFTQTLSYFNVFLAPFTRNIKASEARKALRRFVINLSQQTVVSLDLELTIPSFMLEKAAPGPFGEDADAYKDFKEESRLLAILLLEVFAEVSQHKPLFNPRLIVKIRPEAFTDEEAKKILLRAHSFAADMGVPYFANLLDRDHRQCSFSASGCRLNVDLHNDWETDTLRTGCLGVVSINLPRIAYESDGDRAVFSKTLKERVEMANRALEIKYRRLRQHKKRLLPFLMQSNNGDQYFRLTNCSRIVNLAGLVEAAEAFCGNEISDEDTKKFAAEIAQEVAISTRKIGGRRAKRLFPAMLPSSAASKRLARLDIERYGIARVNYSGERDNPSYGTIRKLTLQDGEIPQQSLTFEDKLGNVYKGGNLAVIELGQFKFGPNELLELTVQLLRKCSFGFFTYNRELTYCMSCTRSWEGKLHKCPICGAVSTLTYFNRFAIPSH